MINHLRTLLLNERRDDAALLEEFIPANFQPLQLGFDTGAVRSLLIRPEFPREYRNYIATLLTGLVYDSPFVPVVNGLDSRTTIDFSVNRTPTLQNQVVLTRQLNASSLHVVGTFVSDVAKGVFQGEWNLRKTSPTTVEVLDQRTAVARSVEIAFNGDSTGLYLLDPLNRLNFQLLGTSALPDLQANVKASNAMYYDVTAALDRLKSNDSANGVFQSTINAQTLRDLKSVFDNSRRPDHAMAAILIAYAFRLSENL